jgi:hypothetical protein
MVTGPEMNPFPPAKLKPWKMILVPSSDQAGLIDSSYWTALMLPGPVKPQVSNVHDDL